MSIGPFNAAPRKSLVGYVEEELRNALVEGRLEPGTRLVTKELADTLGMSITPVREALVRFAASGILTAEPAQSFRVPALSAAQYLELSEVRKAVEGLAAAKAALRIAATDIARMQELLAQYLAAKSAGDPHSALMRNKEFRFVLYGAAEMPTLLSVIETLWLRAGPGFNYLYPEERRPLTIHNNYNELLEALHRRSADAARAAIEHAIDDGAKRVLAAINARESSSAA
ncbi:MULTISPECIES: FCD domain-containing protein [unclassified Chelatococcus]|uniref:FCD domain-containing protein n=1 Tax=unclassified Chelatococcus TaxID=2638111 RepID=UPI001BD007DD|nr:FCD domain-containing protein [Chelatococcus sp.]MBS7699758.1 FCD domain-containing protein [Chelatococcus sp. YT9]MBX3558104.1 FCD domain-containing protein [Chelatococcus sp.]